MNRVLQLAPDFALPLDAVTRRLAILAMSGAGKSNTAVVMAEQMFDAGIPWVAIDPKGDWWGMRSSKSGKGPGLPIPIFGGLHGDVPLEPGAGTMIGELIVERRLTCILDVSEFDTRQGLWGFLIDLGETLLRKNRQALHLFLEEADEYLPQKTQAKGNLPTCLGVWQRVVKRGRFRGIGSTQITQRNASLNKDTLYQAEALIAMRVTGKGDREAVRGWVEHHNASGEIVASLAALADGEGWISSPAWLRTTKRVTFARRQTFDSGGTPVLLEGNAPPATLADVDLEQLKERMAATIAKAKADDPVELRRQLTDVKRQLTASVAECARVRASRPAPAVPAPPMEIPVLTPEMFHRAESLLEQAVALVNDLGAVRRDLDPTVTTLREAVESGRIMAARASRPTAAVAPTSRVPDRAAVRPTVQRSRAPSTPFEGLTAPQQAILDTVATLNARGIPATREAVARWLGIHPNGGRYGTNLGELRAAGYLEGFRLTLDGQAIARSQETGFEAILAALDDEPKRTILRILRDAGRALSREELAAELGLHPNGGRYGSNLGWLRTMGVITDRGPITLTEGAER